MSVGVFIVHITEYSRKKLKKLDVIKEMEMNFMKTDLLDTNFFNFVCGCDPRICQLYGETLEETCWKPYLEERRVYKR